MPYLDVLNCSFTGNSAMECCNTGIYWSSCHQDGLTWGTYYGGGADLRDINGGLIRVANCLFADNTGTNAGGLHVVRHGAMRRHLTGHEAVLGDGGVVRHLAGLAKDNTGYDLGGLLCGSEGTLGVLTTVRVQLLPEPQHVATALVAFTGVREAVEAVAAWRRAVPELEAAGLVVKVPDWWKHKSPPRATVTVQLDAPDRTTVGLDALLKFNVSLAVGDELLTPAEWKQVMAAEGNLVSIKGRWVEVDREKLQQVLDPWEQASAGAMGSGPGALPVSHRTKGSTPVIDPRMPASATPMARCIAVRRRVCSRPYRPSSMMTTPKAAGISAVGLTMSLSTYPPMPRTMRAMPTSMLGPTIRCTFSLIIG